jgi:hypothetical protein
MLEGMQANRETRLGHQEVGLRLLNRGLCCHGGYAGFRSRGLLAYFEHGRHDWALTREEDQDACENVQVDPGALVADEVEITITARGAAARGERPADEQEDWRRA